jgi:hypothetical protein
MVLTKLDGRWAATTASAAPVELELHRAAGQCYLSEGDACGASAPGLQLGVECGCRGRRKGVHCSGAGNRCTYECRCLCVAECSGWGRRVSVGVQMCCTVGVPALHRKGCAPSGGGTHEAVEPTTEATAGAPVVPEWFTSAPSSITRLPPTCRSGMAASQSVSESHQQLPKQHAFDVVQQPAVEPAAQTRVHLHSPHHSHTGWTARNIPCNLLMQ